MGWRLAVWVWLVLGGMGLSLLLAQSADAQSVVRPDVSVGAALRSLASRAQDVFVGQVVQVTRRGGVVEVRFRVEQNIAGTQGETYTLREWAGVWPPGQQRYVVGQRSMMFVYPAAASGLSSPVDGAEGVVPVMVQGVEAEPLLDVRLLATRVLRGQSEPMADVESAAVGLSDAVQVVTTWHAETWHEPVRRPLPIRFRPIVKLPELPVLGRPVSPLSGGFELGSSYVAR